MANSTAQPVVPLPEGCSLLYYSLKQWEPWTGGVVWSFLRPILQGEVHYTPDNPVTRNLMERANKSLEVLDRFRTRAQVLGQVYISLQHISEYLRPAAVLTDLLASNFYSELCASRLNDQYGVELAEFRGGNLSEGVVQVEGALPVLEMVHLVTDSLSCMKTDRSTTTTCSSHLLGRFHPQKTEADIIAQATSEQPNFLAGIVFK